MKKPKVNPEKVIIVTRPQTEPSQTEPVNPTSTPAEEETPQEDVKPGEKEAKKE